MTVIDHLNLSQLIQDASAQVEEAVMLPEFIKYHTIPYYKVRYFIIYSLL